MRLLLVVSILFSLSVSAQMLDNSNCDVFSNNNFFNDEFIKKNGITSIKATISSKQTMKPIKETGLWQSYNFDKYGRVVEMIETSSLLGKFDTSVVHFKYAGEHLNKKRLTDEKGFYSYTYQYDDGKMTQKTYSREVNANKTRDKFELGQLIEIYKETYEHSEISDSKTKTVTYNSDGKPYEQEFREYDEYGNLIKIVKTLVVTKKGSSTTFEYDAYHRPISKTEISNFTGKDEWRFEYEYDEAGNILKERTYHNGEHKTTREYLYDGRMLLSARLTKDEATETIQIVKYQCFFD